MAGSKETYEIDLNRDQMAFIRAAKEKHHIVDAHPVVRELQDFIQTSPNIHDTIFNQTRCLRWE